MGSPADEPRLKPGPEGLGVGDPGGEELVRREAGGAAGPFEHGRENFGVELPAGGFEGRQGREASRTYRFR